MTDERRPADLTYPSLLEDSAEDLYEHAPCGYLSTLLDGSVLRANGTLLGWLGYRREEVVGRLSFTDLLSVGGKIYYETHYAPLLRMQGQAGGIALELRTAAGERLPVLATSVVKPDRQGRPLLVRTTLFDARDRRAYERELLRARQELERERARLQKVLATLQRSLLPPSLPDVPGLEAVAHYHTAAPDDLGGDFYDLFELGGGRWCFFLGDVCGKGPAAAALTSLARYTLRAAALPGPGPAAMLETLHQTLQERGDGADCGYCTALAGVLTRLAGGGFDVVVAAGGHPPALLLRADGAAEYLDTPGGTPVGLLSEPEFVTARARLAPGDTLLLYTDGLTDARAGPGGPDRLGDDALLDFGRRLAPAGPARLVEAVVDLLEELGPGVEDDTALLALGVPRGTG
ncbi:SpoIIE family protein phosphatase [Actinomadura sp. ATCC 31491]|uniref:SpoIIE family protein phosphatase n=1 Tax=Actinomadura luzonensis TaxID=2805427 RepID=A0ABT0FJ66_9ACTN|nr:SpoIIE family protein phosphatase [Actinomadura luzonensis]MCK2212238.1 SpoIIE family protein phosphatase [Actinomadura luzonensis]